MRTVSAYLQGGLGNQCFIYATARAMAIDAAANVLLREDRFIGDGYKRQLSLDDFCCVYEWLPARYKYIRLFHYYFHAFIKKLGRWRLLNTINEKSLFTYHPMPKKWCGDISIDGYWQTEKYFVHHREELLRDFQLKDRSWIEKDAMAQRILKDGDSIFLHVRSYKDIGGHNDGSYALKVSYYVNALKYLAGKGVSGNAYVFSDDLPWAMQRLEGAAKECHFNLIPVEPDPTLLPKDKYSSSYLRDFTLMRLCRHGIVADSSFSWWAGWLGEAAQMAKGQTCLRIRPIKKSIEGLYPDRWVAVPVE